MPSMTLRTLFLALLCTPTLLFAQQIKEGRSFAAYDVYKQQLQLHYGLTDATGVRITVDKDGQFTYGYIVDDMYREHGVSLMPGWVRVGRFKMGMLSDGVQTNMDFTRVLRGEFTGKQFTYGTVYHFPELYAINYGGSQSYATDYINRTIRKVSLNAQFNFVITDDKVETKPGLGAKKGVLKNYWGGMGNNGPTGLGVLYSKSGDESYYSMYDVASQPQSFLITFDTHTHKMKSVYYSLGITDDAEKEFKLSSFHNESAYRMELNGSGAGVIGYVDTTRKWIVLQQGQHMIALWPSGELMVFNGDTKVEKLLNFDPATKVKVTAFMKDIFDKYRLSTNAAIQLTKVQHPTTKLYGYQDQTGKIVIPHKYVRAGDFQNGIASVMVPEIPSQVGWVIDEKGNTVLETNYVDLGDFHNGLASFKRAGSKLYGYMNIKGETVLPEKYIFPAHIFSEGLCIFNEGTNLMSQKHGIMDTLGNVVIPVGKYKFGSHFKQGRAIVYNDKMLNGYVDTKGNIVIPYKYKYAYDYGEDGVAMMTYQDEKGELVSEFRDLNGNLVPRPERYKKSSTQ